MLVFGERRKSENPEENLWEQSREPTDSIHMTAGPGIEPGTYWWKASAFTTTATPLPVLDGRWLSVPKVQQDHCACSFFFCHFCDYLSVFACDEKAIIIIINFSFLHDYCLIKCPPLVGWPFLWKRGLNRQGNLPYLFGYKPSDFYTNQHSIWANLKP